MATQIYDWHGKLAPTVTLTEIRRRPGRFFKMTDRRGAVAISQGGKTFAIALSLDQFVSILFGIQPRPHAKKKKSASK